MKVRIGFVSNSSSVSFCIYGIFVNNPDEQIREIAKGLGLFCHSDQYGDGLYIGRAWADIGDDETGKQFKESTQALADKLPVESKECHTLEEGWYDG